LIHHAAVRVAPCEYKAKRVAQRVHSGVNFCRQTTPAASNGQLSSLPPAPAACWWARTHGPSKMTDSKSGSRLGSPKRVAQTPALAQALIRLYTVRHGPNSSGKSRREAPVRKVQITPVRMRRAAFGLPQGPLRRGRAWGSSLCQRSSEKSCLLLMSSLPRLRQHPKNSLEISLKPRERLRSR
jgi:hypothetical protein